MGPERFLDTEEIVAGVWVLVVLRDMSSAPGETINHARKHITRLTHLAPGGSHAVSFRLDINGRLTRMHGIGLIQKLNRAIETHPAGLHTAILWIGISVEVIVRQRLEQDRTAVRRSIFLDRQRAPLHVVFVFRFRRESFEG